MCSREKKQGNIKEVTETILPRRYAMEELLDKYGVDLAIWAHEHCYERLWPMYNFTVLNGSDSEPYTNAR